MKKTSNRAFTFSVNTIPGTSSEATPRSEVLTSNDDTGSKKLLKTDNELHSSTIAVLGNDDLLIEILLRLPVLSLHLFKSVSKQWLSLITSPNFTLSRKKIPKIDPPAGLFILREAYDYERKMYQHEYDFESFNIRIPSKRSVVFTAGSDAPPCFVRILQSCNGLLLCCIQPYNLYVCNPTIKLFKRLLPTNSDVGNVKIAFDPTKSPHYKVIHAKFVCNDDDDDEFGFGYNQIETYSSETGSWSLCVLTKTELSLFFDGNLLESSGSLLLLSWDDTDYRKFNVLEMKNGCSEWSVKYILNLNEFSMPFPTPWRIDRGVCAIVLGEREEDSYMIIDLWSKVVQYNPMLKTLRTLYDVESTRPSSIPTFCIPFELLGDCNKAIQAVVYRKWTSKHVHTQQLIKYYCIFMDKQGTPIQANMDVKDTDYFDQLLQHCRAYRISGFSCEQTGLWERTLDNPTSLIFGRKVRDDKRRSLISLKCISFNSKERPAVETTADKIDEAPELQGKEISEGPVREVKEETWIQVDTEFVKVLAFRQWHKAFYMKSDLFFVCIMRPSSFDIQIKESEIEAAKIEQYKTKINRLRNMNIDTTKSASRLVEPIHPRYLCTSL
nr:hypothetical protein [Tanacetum cinerariifolium]